MFCKYCGTRLDDVQKFCGVCGRAVDRNIKFADPTAKLIDRAEKNEPEKIEAVAEAPDRPVEECSEVVEEAVESTEDAEEVVEEAVAKEEFSPVELEEALPEIEAEPVKNTGLKIGLLVWTIINMAFGMEVFGIPALILNIRSAKKPENKTKKSISYIKILNFVGSLSLALVVFYCIYMSVKYATNL